MNTHPQVCTHETVCVPCFGVDWIVDAQLFQPKAAPPPNTPGIRPYSVVDAVKFGGRWFYAEDIFNFDFIECIESALDAMPFNDDRETS